MLVFLPTVQHTGTWFCIDFFRGHPDVSWVAPKMEWNVGKLSREIENGNTMVLQTHVGGAVPPILLEGRGFSCQSEVQDWTRKADRVVIPLRDPLRSLLTSYVRKSPLGIVDGFLFLVELHSSRDIFTVPVDLYAQRPVEARHALIQDLLDHTGLSPCEFTSQWAEQWPVKNTTIRDMPGRPAKKRTVALYDVGDVRSIRALVPREWDRLTANEPVLRPFLEQHGYENLLWWS